MKKHVHLIRHGQSLFNAAFAQSRVDPMIFDAPLSPLGREQVATMRATGSALDVEVIVTSPLTRAIETTLGVFADHGAAMVVEALHRERVEHSCDVGRSPAALAEAFPQLAFHHLDDPWWHSDGSHPRAIVVEPEPVLMARVAAFRAWLKRRPERVIAVVGHGTFLNRLTGHLFQNCELLSIDL
ncbi:MAG TPA: histidine phosphatase family protein [Alphaproteobacteria bacterium]|nr:histidine phosphatase family protein [Alphaproteobacteria bacterium]